MGSNHLVGDQHDMISGINNVRGLQTGGLGLIETNVNVEWKKKYEYRDNNKKLLRKTNFWCHHNCI